MIHPHSAAMAAETSYASTIIQYVKEDKVLLLEKIRGQLTKPSEKLVVQALLTEDGPQAAALYREQLNNYPDPKLDPISRARLKAYEQAVVTAGEQPVIPTTKPATSAMAQPAGAAETNGLFTLQFGSFDSITNADQLVAQLAPSAAASVQVINGVYKVRLMHLFNSRKEAAAFGMTLPVESIVVPAQ